MDLSILLYPQEGRQMLTDNRMKTQLSFATLVEGPLI